MDPAFLSVVVRVRDEAAALDHCLGLVRAQDLPDGVALQLIVVDNDSRDGSADVAARHGAEVVGISRRDFSFGRALNHGFALARGEVTVALSAHAYPHDETWLADMIAAFADPRVAAASGEVWLPDGTPLLGAIAIDADMAAGVPSLGYTNAAGGVRTALWATHPFREDLPACEDREWGRWALGEGYVIVLDPVLAVEHDHTHDPVWDIFLRARREASGYAAFLGAGEQPPGPASLGGLVGRWWSDTRFYESPWRARLSPRRTAQLLGAYVGH